MNVTTEFVTHLTSLITGAFTSLAALIASPLGGLIIFGIAVGYLMYVRKMASGKNARAQ